MFSCEYCKILKKTLFKEHHRWLLLLFKFIANLMTHINCGIDDIYFQYNTLCLYHVFLHFLSVSVLLKLLKYVKLIVFENYNECKMKHVFDKKVVTRFDKRNSGMAKKEHWWREEYVTVDPKEEDPISEDSKKTLSLRTLKRILSVRNLKRTFITVKPKDNAINENLQELQDPEWLLRRKLTRFDFW